MAAQTLDRATLSETELPKKKEYTVERPRVPLALKLFGLTALLILIVVGIAVGITIERANRVANTTVNASITSAAKLFRQFESLRLGRLAGVTEVLGSDSNFYAYIQNALAPAPEPTPVNPAAPTAAAAATPAAPPQIDYSSINDTLLEQRDRLKTDVMMLLDDQGNLVARTDQPMLAAASKEDFYEQISLVHAIVDDETIKTTSGVMNLGGKLYHAAVAPVAAGARGVRIAYLISAYAIDQEFANRIAEATNAEVVFSPAKATQTLVRSNNAPSVMPQQLGAAKTETVTVDRSRYILTSEPLLSGNAPVGKAIFLRSLDRELGPFREIENAMFIGGGIALLLALLFS